MPLADYSDDDDFYTQRFQKEGVLSVWLGLQVPDDNPDLDILQDLCGVGYYRPEEQEGNKIDFECVGIASLLRDLSYSSSYAREVEAAAMRRGIEKVRWLLVQFDFQYDPARVSRPIAQDPVFLGVFPYARDD
jgi:hypothetical protein